MILARTVAIAITFGSCIACSVSTAGTSITVFAAASLTEAFTQIAEAFEVANPGANVTFNFAASSTLAHQILQGAPADVFASAAPSNMRAIATTSVTFATNRLQIAVPKGNPGNITGLRDFADGEKKIAICAEQVPCGAAAAKVFAAGRIVPRPDTLEQDVKAVLTKVRLGEVDAGLVYRSDVIAARSDVEGIEFPESSEAVNEYQVALVGDAGDAAEDFVAHVRSDGSRRILSEAGFGAP